MSKMPERPTLLDRSREYMFGGGAGGVFRGMLTLALGRGTGHLIGIAALPVLTRLYTPVDFGAMAVFTALVAILAPLVTLRYVLALPLPHQNGTAMNLMVLSLVLMLGLSAAITSVLALWGAQLLTFASMEVLIPWWWLIAVGVLSTAVYELLTMWATRRRAYAMIARSNVRQSSLGALAKIILGIATLQPHGLIIGQIIAQSGGIGRLFTGFWTEFRAHWRYVRLIRMRKIARHFVSFPLYRLPSQLLVAVSSQAPIFLVATLFSAGETGQLALANMIVALPVSLISASTANAYYAEASETYRTGNKIYKLTLGVAKRSFALSVIPTAAISLLAFTLFPLVFGAEWALAGVIASLLALSMPAQFVSHVVLKSLPIIGRNDLYFLLTVFRSIFIVVSIIAPAALGYGVVKCILVYVLALSVQRVFEIKWTLRKLRAK